MVNEALDNKTPREKLEEKLQAPAKFITLDTKLSAALTRSAKGDLATKIHNFKDEESKNGIQVRGRRVLLMLEDYFRTSEKAGSLYRVEDLLEVVRTAESVEDLRRFLSPLEPPLPVWKLHPMIWFSEISFSDKSGNVNS